MSHTPLKSASQKDSVHNLIVVHEEANQFTWIVRLVWPGDHCGAGFGRPLQESKASVSVEQGARTYGDLVHDAKEPSVEFFDPRYPFSNLGQFVSSYLASTLVEKPYDRGLLLDTGSPDWVVSPQAMEQVRSWLRFRLEAAQVSP